MQELPYIDFHCHSKANIKANVLSIRSAEPLEQMPTDTLISIGLHPWCDNIEVAEKSILQLPKICKQHRVVAIGEIGLDRKRGLPLNTQIELVQQQLQIAESIGLPVVLHCVAAWSELLAMLNHYPSIRWTIHGFRGDVQLAHKILEAGGMLSFGAHIIRPTPQLTNALQNIPAQKFFIETDASNTPIEEVYLSIAKTLNIPVNELITQQHLNAQQFFERELLALFNTIR